MAARGSVLVAVDTGAEHDRGALFREAAIRAADGGRIVVLTVVPELYLATATNPRATIEAMRARAKTRLDRLVDASGIAGAETRVEYGPVSGTILDVAAEIGAGIILIHARRPGPAAYALGSVASRVANHAAVSVLVVRD